MSSVLSQAQIGNDRIAPDSLAVALLILTSVSGVIAYIPTAPWASTLTIPLCRCIVPSTISSALSRMVR